MRAGTQTRVRPTAAPAASFTPAPSGLLQRKCACGGSAGLEGECEECRKEREAESIGGSQTLQRGAASRTEPTEVPPIVYDVLRSPGQPLDFETRAFFEPRFGHDFSRVHVHTDARAAESAAALNAEAYTVGSHVVFGSGRCRLDTLGGVHLIAHELAHTIQQGTQAPILQKSFRVGGVDDPAEAAADRAADAAVRSDPMPSLAMSEPVIRRRWVERTPDKDVRVVWEDYKTRYRVTRTRELRPHTETQYFPPSVTADADRTNLWLRVEWCQGTKGSVELGADVPQQLQNLIRDILQTIASGGKAEDVIKKTNLTPYVNVVITKSGSWQLSGGVHVTVGQQGVTGGGGQIGFKKGEYEVGVGVDVEGRRNVTPTVTLKGPLPGEPKLPKFDCPTREKLTVVEVVKFKCVKEEYTPPHDVPPPEKKVPDSRERYIYFLYAKDKVNHNLVGEGDLTAASLDALKGDFRDGYRVAQITGYTSPEGPMQPRGHFEGNIALGKERAEAAKKLVLERCAGDIPMRAVTGQLPVQIPQVSWQPPNLLDACFVGGADAVVPQGGGELHTKVEKGKELEGKPLAKHAVGEFEGAKEETPQRTPELMKQLEQKATPEEKAELVYPKLRRAAIMLIGEKTVKEGEPRHVEGGFTPSNAPCPPSVPEFAFPTAEDILR